MSTWPRPSYSLGLFVGEVECQDLCYTFGSSQRAAGGGPRGTVILVSFLCTRDHIFLLSKTEVPLGLKSEGF